MPSNVVDFPVFDADNHMYETTDAFTKFLPKEYEGLVKYVQVNGRTKIALRNVISDYIPNPTFEVVGRPGAQEAVLQGGQPRGQDPPRDDRRGDALARGLLLARAAAQDHGRARPGPGAHVADAGQPARGASGRRPEGDARRRPRAEPVDARALDLQLRGAHLPDPGHHAAHRRRGDQGARVGRRARGQDHPHPARAGPGLPGAPVVRAPRVRPVLGSASPSSTSRSACTPPTTG